MTRVKICGVNSAEAFKAAVAAQADYVGFVFYPPSPRAVTPEEATALSRAAELGPLRFGLFVEPTDEDVAEALATVRLDGLQLHGVTADRASALRRRFEMPVWRAIGVARAEDLPRDPEDVDAVLLDAPSGSDAKLPGGNARVFDWSLLEGWRPSFTWVLAGGLTPRNVADAVQKFRPDVVDVSSGVESARGRKDPALIRAFVAAVRQAASVTRPAD